MFEHITALSKEYDSLSFPEIELTIKNSNRITVNGRPIQNDDAKLYSKAYDLIIDISVNETSENIELFGKYNVKMIATTLFEAQLPHQQGVVFNYTAYFL